MDPETSKRIAKSVDDRVKTYALVPKEDREMSLSIYKQVCLFEEFHLPMHYMFTNRIVFDEKSKTFSMVKRSEPLKATDFTLEDRHDVGGKIPTFSQRSGFDASFKNHDHDDLLFNALNCTIELKELL